MFTLHWNKYTTLKYAARRLTSFNIIFDWVTTNQFLLDWLGFGSDGPLLLTCRSSYSSSLLGAYKPNETRKLLSFERDSVKV